MMSHVVEKPFKCAYCPEEFPTQYFLSQHEIVQHDIVSSGDSAVIKKRCDVPHCGQSFQTMEELKLHFETHGSTPYQCGYQGCTAAFSLRNERKNHRKMHHEKRHLCSECGVRVATPAELKYHMVVHTGERPYKCSYCPALFGRKGTARAHEARHTLGEDKPHLCPLCGKTYRNKYSLTQHMKEHSGHKPFQCDFCEQKFFRSDQLKVHERTHTGEKPYKCTMCESSYAHNVSLRTHMEKKHRT